MRSTTAARSSNLARINPAHIGMYSCNEFGFASDNIGAICTDIYQPDGSVLHNITHSVLHLYEAGTSA